MTTTFEALGVPDTILAALHQMGYETPTPVQAAAMPPALEGRDVLIEAQTGTGKTAAYGVPTVLAGSRKAGLQVLVVVPTRELARQVAQQIREIGTGSPFRCVAVTGGVAAEREARALGGDVRAVVATPGRLLALMEEGGIRLDKVALVILDEADRMLDMGFKPDVERILEATAHRAQTILASATLPPGVTDLVERHLNEPTAVRIKPQPIPESLSHHRVNVFPGDKEAALLALLRAEAPERAVVFVRTRERAVEFTRLLKNAGFAADALQGEMPHEKRRHVFDLFQRGVTSVLVATDLASRGLDVPEIELVVNVDLPDEQGQYVHRAGRAARMGRVGKVVNLVLPDEKAQRIGLEKEAGKPFEPYRLEYDREETPPPHPDKPDRRRIHGNAPREAPRSRDARAAPSDEPGVPPSRRGRPRR